MNNFQEDHYYWEGSVVNGNSNITGERPVLPQSHSSLSLISPILGSDQLNLGF